MRLYEFPSIITQDEILKEKGKLIKRQLSLVEDSPEGRFQLGVRFYEKYGNSRIKHSMGPGNGELKFIRWQINRGVLNAMKGSYSGSAWWRAVNFDMLYTSNLASAVYEERLPVFHLPDTVKLWIAYFQTPGVQTWFRAFNASLVKAYFRHIELAKQENRAERLLINEVLYRFLFAHATAEGVDIGLGKLRRVLKNPPIPTLEEPVVLPSSWPVAYPISRSTYKNAQKEGHTLNELGVSFVDDYVVLPQLDDLYAQCAHLMIIPELMTFSMSNIPVYPSMKIQHYSLNNRVRNWLKPLNDRS